MSVMTLFISWLLLAQPLSKLGYLKFWNISGIRETRVVYGRIHHIVLQSWHWAIRVLYKFDILDIYWVLIFNFLHISYSHFDHECSKLYLLCWQGHMISFKSVCLWNKNNRSCEFIFFKKLSQKYNIFVMDIMQIAIVRQYEK